MMAVSKSVALLMRNAYQRVDGAVLGALAAAGYDEIQPGHGIVLRNLGEDGARPSEIAARAEVTRQAVTKVLDDLERLNVVRREPDPDDGRGVIVHYTPYGLSGLRVARARMDELEGEFAAHVGSKRWEITRAVLEKLFE